MSIIVRARDKDNTDSLIRKFQKIVASEGVIQQYRDREYYKKNSIKRQERLAEKRRKIMRAKRYANMPALTPPMLRLPVGLGAKRVMILFFIRM